MNDSKALFEVEFLSPVEDIDPDNDNADIQVHLKDGRSYGLLTSTPSNVIWCMDNMGIDHFFSTPPPLLVRRLDRDHVHNAVAALINEEDGRSLERYGVRQTQDE